MHELTDCNSLLSDVCCQHSTKDVVAAWFRVLKRQGLLCLNIDCPAVILIHVFCLASSREKAPFVLIVETLAAEVQPPNDAAPSTSSQGMSEAGDEDGEGSARTSARRQASSQYADSVQSLLAGRLGSNALAGPGPGSPQQGDGKSVHRRNDTAGSRLPSPGSPAAEHSHAQALGWHGPSEMDSLRPARSELTTRRSLSFSEALPEPDPEQKSDQARQQMALPQVSANTLQGGRPSPRPLGRSPRGKSGHHDDAFARYCC